MPLTVPSLDDRDYRQLRDDMLRRIPAHTPDWTNFGKSDPGVTLLELFAFLGESLLYRANQIPERNRKKFLSLLRVPLQPAASARALLQFANERGTLATVTLGRDLEARAGKIAFRTTAGLDVLPVEARAYVKQLLTNPSPETESYYNELFTSYKGQPPTAKLTLYQTTPLDSAGDAGIDLGAETVDRAVWIALLVRQVDKPAADYLQQARDVIGGKTLSLAIVPITDPEDAAIDLPPVGVTAPSALNEVTVEIPKVPASGGLEGDRIPTYRTLLRFMAPDEPDTCEITLPPAADIQLWNNLEPLEEGSDLLPPSIEDTDTADRVLTWLKLTWPAGATSRILWTGINCVAAGQRVRIVGEVLPAGTGLPDQEVSLANPPVIAQSVTLSVIDQGTTSSWAEIEDIDAAAPEVQTDDPAAPPGQLSLNSFAEPAESFELDAEAGVLRFGDGYRGRRPARGAILRVNYDHSDGSAGNVAADTITDAPSLPSGLTVTNPVRSWGGADAESTADAEERIPQYLRHRDRLVSVEDFQTLTRRAPGVRVGRVDVLPAWHPVLSPNEPGDAAGAVTLMVIPENDAAHPDTPEPDTSFLRAICDHLEPRRLVTTEVFLRGPDYQDIWISVGISLVAGQATSEVRDAVEQALRSFLSPLPRVSGSETDLADLLRTSPQYALLANGWPLRRSINAAELMAEASRVAGVATVNGLQLAAGNAAPANTLPMRGLELPRVAGVSVVVGDPLDLDEFRGLSSAAGTGTGTGTSTGPAIVPVPVILEEC